MVALLSSLLIVVAAPPAAVDVQKSAKRVLDSSYQRQLPGEQAERKATDSTARRRRWVPPKRMRRSDRPADKERAEVPSAMSTVATWLMYILVVIVAVVLGLFLASELTRFAGDMESARDGPDGDGEQALPDVVARPLEDAELLASRGEFGDAIRALLLRTLGELTRRVQEPISPSLTSREVLTRVSLTDDARMALTGLVTAVELTHFGNEVPGRGDYDECMSHFRAFASAYMRGGA